MRAYALGAIPIASFWIVVCFYNPLVAVIGNALTIIPYASFCLRRETR